MSEIIKEKIAFDEKHGEWRFLATYLVEPKGEALIEISKGDMLVKSMLWPAYKIWNIAAHAGDIIEDLEHGLSTAGSDGLGGNVYK